MKRMIPAFLAAGLALGAAALPALAESDEGSVDPALEAKITAQLTAEGYEVRSIVTEDGRYEVYAMKDGKKFELYLDESLKIVDSKQSG